MDGDKRNDQHNVGGIGGNSIHQRCNSLLDRHKDEDDFAGAFQQTDSDNIQTQNLTGTGSNSRQGIQNLTGLRLNASHDEPNMTGSRLSLKDDFQNLTPNLNGSRLQRPRNADFLSRSRNYREHLFGEDSSLEHHYPASTTYSPRSRLDEPYIHSSPFLPSPRLREGTYNYRDVDIPVPSKHSSDDIRDLLPETRDTHLKKNENLAKTDEGKQEKEKKSITTKTFAHGMMDISLLTSNSTQLRAILSNPGHEFYTLLLWLIGLSIILQISSAVLLILSDFFKTQVKEKDLQNQKKRKILNFLSLALVTIVTSLNVLISAFSSPSVSPTQHVSMQRTETDVPAFSSVHIPLGQNHTEL